MTTLTFSVDELVDAIETRNATAQAALYTDDATLTVVDQDHGPAAPLVLHGSAVADHLREVCEREMTHTVSDVVFDGDRLAFRVDCEYPQGTRVACLAIARLRDGRIFDQSGVQVWDA